MSYKFSERVKHVLQQAGWYEGRSVDVSEAVRLWRKSASSYLHKPGGYWKRFMD
jgi:hypothetical protein